MNEIILTEEQKQALAINNLTLQEFVDQKLALLVNNMNADRALSLFNTVKDTPIVEQIKTENNLDDNFKVIEPEQPEEPTKPEEIPEEITDSV